MFFDGSFTVIPRDSAPDHAAPSPTWLGDRVCRRAPAAVSCTCQRSWAPGWPDWALSIALGIAVVSACCSPPSAP